MGGAEADFITDGCLWEVKTTKRPSEVVLGAVRQLIGYLLLDYADEHGIESVGIYLSRQGVYYAWHAQDLLKDLAGDRGLSLAEFRHQFQGVLAALRRR